MKYYAWYYRAEAGKLSAQNRIVKILGSGAKWSLLNPLCHCIAKAATERS